MTRKLYDDVTYPAELHSFIKVKDMSHLPETKLIMEVPDKVRAVLMECDKETFTGVPTDEVEDVAIRTTRLKKVLPEEFRGNRFTDMFYSTRSFLGRHVAYSITGGTCRNILMGIEGKTDVDVVVDETMGNPVAALQMCFKELETDNRTIRQFEIGDNTMHVIPSGFSLTHNDESGELFVDHVFVDPLRFDFTVNCGCISSKDGWLYASPITMFDTKNKILRSTYQLSDKFNQSGLLKLPLMIRTIRFAIKYDMKIHNALYDALKVYFRLEASRQGCDDASMYYGLKHVMEDPPAVKEEFWRIFKSLGVYETDRFEKFEDYFKYIDQSRKILGRRSKIRATANPDVLTY